MFMPHRRYLLILAVLFGGWWIALAIHPLYRNPWLLENGLALAAVALLALFHRRLLFSRVSYTLIFVFMCLHQIGELASPARLRPGVGREPSCETQSPAR